MKLVVLPFVATGLFFSASALAQEAPPPPPAPPPPATPAAAHVEEVSDHEAMVHHFAVGYLGASQIPIAFANAGGGGALTITQGDVTAPFIGVRYWISNLLGIDVGLGFAYAGGSSTTVATPPGQPAATTTIDKPSVTGFGVHAGVPLALAYSKHFTFEVIPEVNFGYATSTVKQVVPAGQPAQPDINLNGVRFDIGARIGGEVHFGFMGVPQLSLQATIGLGFLYTGVKGSLSDGTASQSITTPAFGTSLQDSPWAIFRNNVAALYYF